MISIGVCYVPMRSCKKQKLCWTCRHPELEIDKNVYDYLLKTADDTQVILQVFTKIDKLNQKEIGRLRNRFPDAIMISNLQKKGIESGLRKTSS